MKYLKYLLGLIVILAIGFFLMGLIKPKLSYDCETTVNKPLAESWAVVQDESKMADWLEGFQKTEHISGTPGTVGAVSDVYFIQDGEEMTIRETITALVPNESISMTFTSDFMNMDYTLNMASVDDGTTKISSNTIAQGNGIISKSIMAVMGGSVKGQEETNLANLKKTIEANTTDYFPEEEEPIEAIEVEEVTEGAESSGG